MPNHILNILKVTTSSLSRTEEIVSALKSTTDTDCVFDMEKFIPMPEEFADDWYNWRLEHWGTKWNTYDGFVELDGTLCFNTAWATPFAAVLEVSKAFPDATFGVTYADEDVGFNVGRYKVQNGEVLEKYCPEGGSDEAMALYFICHPEDIDEIVKCKDGQWRRAEWMNEE